MNFSQSENQNLVRSTIAEFAKKEILPNVMKWDESQEFPRHIFAKLGDLGFMGILVPEEYGGAGMGYDEYIVAIEELSKVCGSIGLSYAAHNSLCTMHLFQFGNEEQRRKYSPKLASGEFIGAWGLTEPNTGSDAMRMLCTAKQDGDNWIINGTKIFITHGLTGDVMVVIARTGDLLDSHGRAWKSRVESRQKRR
jgi:alkylation response protein AidB-like acyl-CoA dehydrogenase